MMLETLGFRVAQHSHEGNAKLGHHSHPFAHLCVVIEGGFAERRHQGTNIVDQGMALVRPPRDEHSNSICTCGSTTLHFDVRYEWLSKQSYGAVFSEYASLRSTRIASAVEEIKSLWQAAHQYSASRVESLLELETAILEILTHVVRYKSKIGQEDWLQTLREKIEANPFRLWTLAFCADIVDRHPTVVARAFRDRYGETVGQFFRRHRMERCHRLVEDGNIPLAQLARRAGFADQSHFTRAFKQAFGISPAQSKGKQAS